MNDVFESCGVWSIPGAIGSGTFSAAGTPALRRKAAVVCKAEQFAVLMLQYLDDIKVGAVRRGTARRGEIEPSGRPAPKAIDRNP